ncbi:hypothetical protein ALC57_16627, partial [Trachymyrmex cornetzi]
DRSRGVGDGVRGWRGQWRSELMATVGAQPRKIDAKDSPSSADNRTPPFLDNFESSYVSLECVRAYTRTSRTNYPGHKFKRAILGVRDNLYFIQIYKFHGTFRLHLALISLEQKL